MKRLTMVQWLIETTYLCLQINILHCEKKLAYPPTASGYYGRQEGRESHCKNYHVYITQNFV